MKFASGIERSNRFAPMPVRKVDEITALVSQGWVPIAEDTTTVLLWWPCHCDPPSQGRATTSPPPDRGALD